MHYINQEGWARQEHFNFFKKFGYPHFSLCANVDVTEFYPIAKRYEISFTVAIVYIITKAANAIPEFRHRIRGEAVIEHERVHPGFTILVDDETFTFCQLDYTEKFSLFAKNAAEKIAYVKANPTLDSDKGRDDLLFMTAIPWISFTSVMHPLDLYPADSIPRFAWGKFFNEGDRLKMPLNAQGHHALMDGLHFGKFYKTVQDYLDQPDLLFDEA
ncbi:MAG: chloramphenicol acetyltransferase [Chloroflexota bacterium]